MGRGRPPKPSRLKELTGNPGKRPLNEFEPQPELLSEPPEPPDVFVGDKCERAIAEWNHAARLLVELGMLTECDLQALAIYCQAVQDYWDAVEHIRENGATIVVGQNGSEQQAPQVAIARAAAKQIKEFGALFGFSPSDRSRLKIIPPGDTAPTDPLASFGESKNG